MESGNYMLEKVYSFRPWYRVYYLLFIILSNLFFFSIGSILKFSKVALRSSGLIMHLTIELKLGSIGKELGNSISGQINSLYFCLRFIIGRAILRFLGRIETFHFYRN